MKKETLALTCTSYTDVFKLHIALIVLTVSLF